MELIPLPLSVASISIAIDLAGDHGDLPAKAFLNQPELSQSLSFHVSRESYKDKVRVQGRRGLHRLRRGGSHTTNAARI